MTGHEHPNVGLVRESMDAMERGDMQWLSEHIADDVVWHVGGNSKMAGEYRGKESLMQMMPSGDAASSNKIEAHDVLANDDHAVVIGNAHIESPDGDSVDYKFVNVFHIRDGKVTEAWGLAENDAEIDPFFDKLAPA